MDHFENESYIIISETEIVSTKISFKTDSITKLSNFNFQWTKTMYQNILSHFKGYKCFYEITPKKRFLWEPKEINNFKFRRN